MCGGWCMVLICCCFGDLWPGGYVVGSLWPGGCVVRDLWPGGYIIEGK